MDMSTYRVMLRLNPWIEDKFAWTGYASSHLPENYIVRSLSPELSKDKVTIIIGPRQAGKSTLASKTISSSLKPFIFINSEEQLLKEICSSPALFLDEMDSLAQQKQAGCAGTTNRCLCAQRCVRPLSYQESIGIQETYGVGGFSSW